MKQAVRLHSSRTMTATAMLHVEDTKPELRICLDSLLKNMNCISARCRNLPRLYECLYFFKRQRVLSRKLRMVATLPWLATYFTENLAKALRTSRYSKKRSPSLPSFENIVEIGLDEALMVRSYTSVILWDEMNTPLPRIGTISMRKLNY